MQKFEDPSRSLPYGQYEYVEVEFNSSADTDTIVRHSLRPASPRDVDYTVVRKQQACDVYEDVGLDRREWTNQYIVLRSTVASAKVTLLLTTRR